MSQYRIDIGTVSLVLPNTTATPATLNAPLTVTTLNSTSLTASYSVQTDASKNLVSVINTGTGANVLSTAPILATPTLGVANATAVYLSTDSTGIPKISMFGTPANNFQYDGFATLTTTLVYHVAGTTSNHIFYAGLTSTTRSELFRVKGTGGFESNGNSTVTGTLAVSSWLTAIPSYRASSRTSNQTIAIGASAVVNWTDQANVGNIATFLTSSAGRYTNASGGILRVRVTYMIFWDGTILVDLLRAAVIKNGTIYYGHSRAPTNPTINWASQTMTTVVDLANTDYFEVFVSNTTTSALDIIGNTFNGSSPYCEMTMHILN